MYRYKKVSNEFMYQKHHPHSCFMGLFYPLLFGFFCYKIWILIRRICVTANRQKVCQLFDVRFDWQKLCRFVSVMITWCHVWHIFLRNYFRRKANGRCHQLHTFGNWCFIYLIGEQFSFMYTVNFSPIIIKKNYAQIIYV